MVPKQHVFQRLRVTEHKVDVRTGNGMRRFYQNRHWALSVCN